MLDNSILFQKQTTKWAQNNPQNVKSRGSPICFFSLVTTRANFVRNIKRMCYVYLVMEE